MSLRGKKIVLTGTDETIENVAILLRTKGAEPVAFSTIAVSTLHSQENHETIRSVANFNWIIFTSKKAVRTFFELLKAEQIDKLPPEIKLAAIGEKTKRVLEEFGYLPAFLNKGKDKLDLAKNLQQMAGNTDKILLPISTKADETLEEMMADFAQVKMIEIYENHLPKEVDDNALKTIKTGNYHFIIFTSPSAAENFEQITGLLPPSEKAVSIGSTTTEGLKDLGIKPALEAAKPSAESIVDSLEKLYTDKK